MRGIISFIVFYSFKSFSLNCTKLITPYCFMLDFNYVTISLTMSKNIPYNRLLNTVSKIIFLLNNYFLIFILTFLKCAYFENFVEMAVFMLS